MKLYEYAEQYEALKQMVWSSGTIYSAVRCARKASATDWSLRCAIVVTMSRPTGYTTTPRRCRSCTNTGSAKPWRKTVGISMISAESFIKTTFKVVLPSAKAGC